MSLNLVVKSANIINSDIINACPLARNFRCKYIAPQLFGELPLKSVF